MKSPEALILKTDGTNCDYELANAFEVAGASPEIVHVNELRDGSRSMDEFDILGLAGGFSYGDDIASGRILANELTSFLSDQLQDFVDKDRPVIGICNGFQVLVKTGLLPDRTLTSQTATLTDNEIGRFECRWVDLAVGESACRYVQPEDFEKPIVPIQTAHAEGRYLAHEDALCITRERQVVFRYAMPDATPATAHPENPNGSLDSIAGICDPSGTILGMMPHPERSIEAFHPDRSRTEAARTAARTIFGNIVEYAAEL